MLFFFFSSRRRHTRYWRDWSSDVCSSDLLEKTSGEYCRIITADIKKTVKEHECVEAFEKSFKDAFGKFDDYLYDELIAKMDTLGISKTEEVLRSEEHTSELQSRQYLVCRLLLEKKKNIPTLTT